MEKSEAGFYEYRRAGLALSFHEGHWMAPILLALTDKDDDSRVLKRKKAATPDEKLRRRKARERVRQHAREIYRHASPVALEVIEALTLDGEVKKSRLIDEITGGDPYKFRGTMSGLGRICKTRKLDYPIRHDGERYYLAPYFADVFDQLFDSDDE